MAGKLKSLGSGRAAPDEIARAMEPVLHTLPAATAGQSAGRARPASSNEPLVQINFKCSRALAKLIDELCSAEHITQRAAIARAFRALGYDVPEPDLNATARKRRYD
jgi:hypothetical protein